ncbi:MAG: LON peptidase substrate-binding domain-containing protein, partial [Pseudomonadota bacterium]
MIIKYDEYPLIPLRGLVIPHTSVMPIFVGRASSLYAVEAASAADKKAVFVTQKSTEIDSPSKDDLYDVGVVADIVQILKMPDGSLKLLIEAYQRAEIIKVIEQKSADSSYTIAKIKPLHEKGNIDNRTLALIDILRQLFESYSKFDDKVHNDAVILVNQIQ